MTRTTLVVYASDNEVLICALKDEHTMLNEWFYAEEGVNRKLENYTREEWNEVVRIAARLAVRIYG